MKSPHGKNNETLSAPVSSGCSQPKKLAPKWAALIPSRPKSHNHCAEVLATLQFSNPPKATNNHGSEIIFSKDRLAHYPYISATVYIDADAARRRSPLADSTRCSRELCRRRKTSLRTRVSLIRGETIAGPIPRLTRYGLEPLGDH